MTEKYKYGTLIARFIGDRISSEESRELNKWIAAHEQNRALFEQLTNEWNPTWAKQWFAEAGVPVGFIKWKKTEGWYRPETKNRRDYYIIMAVAVVVMVIVYVIFRFA